MLVNSKTISFIIACVITIVSLFIHWIAGFRELWHIFWIHLSILISSFILVYITVEYLIFKEINKIYDVLDRLRQKESSVNLKDFKTKNLPIKRKKIFEEVYTYVSKKQAEINEKVGNLSQGVSGRYFS